MPGSFEAKYSREFLADFARLQPHVQRRVLEAIETKFLIDPFKYAKKLAARSDPGRWRFRVGDYRIRFDIEGRRLVFHRVRHRRDIYD
jgi:mRNA interferase RelE/StbE